jgi:hypothetical protein
MFVLPDSNYDLLLVTSELRLNLMETPTVTPLQHLQHLVGSSVVLDKVRYELRDSQNASSEDICALKPCLLSSSRIPERVRRRRQKVIGQILASRKFRLSIAEPLRCRT